MPVTPDASLPLQRYLEQVPLWPRDGRHILAHFDAETIVVYQAYRPSIGRWAVEHGQLGGPEFGYGRMSWVKPNFLWMMYGSAGDPGRAGVRARPLSRTLFRYCGSAQVTYSVCGV
jgi:Domain of unknown function (DUF4291)